MHALPLSHLSVGSDKMRTKKGKTHHCGLPPKLESYKKSSYYIGSINLIPSSTACIFSGIMA